MSNKTPSSSSTLAHRKTLQRLLYIRSHVSLPGSSTRRRSSNLASKRGRTDGLAEHNCSVVSSERAIRKTRGRRHKWPWRRMLLTKMWATSTAHRVV